MKRIVALALATSICVSLATSPNANAGRVLDPNLKNLGLHFVENEEVTNITSVIYGRLNQDSALDYKICKTATDSTCDAATHLFIIQFFSPCVLATDVNCIEEVFASKDGVKIVGKYQRHFPASGTADFPAEPKMKLPAGKGSSFVVKIPGVVHEGGSDEYLVALSNKSNIYKKAGESAENFEIGVNELIGSIAPFEIVAGNYRAVTVEDGYSSNGGVRLTPSGETCFATETGTCAAVKNFPKKYQFGMTVRLSKKLNGWFHGRISTPKVKTSSTEQTYSFTIEAYPVKVASLDFVVPTSELSQELRDLVFNGKEWGMTGDEKGIKIVAPLDLDLSQTLLKLFTPNFKDTATRTSDYWTFYTLGGYRDDPINKCSNESGSLAGVVTTNSLLYSSGPPTFNKQESSLDYKVSSPHFESSGQEATGTYDLLLRSDVARCIYGFTEAPIKASLEVISSDGTSQIATTTINEKDGWIYMSASGFGYSAPIVRAKLSQEKSVNNPVTQASPSPTTSANAVVTPAPTSTQGTSASKSKTKKTITCTKSGSRKKVTAMNPKCPQGWKKA